MRHRATGMLFVLSGTCFRADGLSTAYFALLAPAAMGCIAAAILHTRALPRWTRYVFLAATVLLPGRYAAFRGALPFPQFLAFIAIGIAALAHRAPTALPPQAIVGIPGPDRLSARHYTGGADDQPSPTLTEPRLPSIRPAR